MSRHEIGGPPPAATDTAIDSVPLDFKKDSSKKRTNRKRYYDEQKANAISPLWEIIREEDWHHIDSSLERSTPQTIESTIQWVEYARDNDLNEENVFEGEEKELGDKEKPNKAVRKAVVQLLNKCRLKKNDGGSIGTTSGTDTKRKNSPGAQQTIHVPPLPSQSSPRLSPQGTPHDKQRKRLKVSHDNCIDITVPATDAEETRRRKTVEPPAQRANRIYLQLEKQEKHEKLHDDTIYMVSEAFKLGLLPSNTTARILDPLLFDIDREEIAPELKDIPKPGERIYVPLHHKNPGHWTLCVLEFELEFKSDATSNSKSSSEVKSISLDFYDSSDDKDRTDKVKAFFTRWIKARYHNCKTTFQKQNSAQQKDGISCGVFVLETLRRLIASESVTRTITPMDVRKDLLNTIASLDTYPPSDSELSNVLREMKALHRDRNKVLNMASPPHPAQEPTRAVPPGEMIKQIREMITGGMTIAERLSTTQEEQRQIAEKAARVERELGDAQKELETANTKAVTAEEVFTLVSKFNRAGEPADPLLNGSKTQETQATQATKDEPVSDEKPDTRAEETRSLAIFSDQVCDLVSVLLQKQRDDDDKKRAEAMMEAMLEDRRVRLEEVEMAKRKVEELSKQAADLRRIKSDMEALVLFCRGLDGPRHKGGGDVDVP